MNAPQSGRTLAGKTSRFEVSSADFVGRGRELAALTEALEQAEAGRGSLFLIGGEPGIGKSRLADELARHARDRGVTVLWGRCWEGGGAPAYWPWVQSLRAYLRLHEPAQLRAQLAGCAAVAQLLPELEALAPDLPKPAVTDAESARFLLFDAVVSFLRTASSHGRPQLLIVIDDLQAADTPSLLLLRFLASQLVDSRLLLLGTYRDIELTPHHPLSRALGEMAREPTTSQLHLSGLALPDVEALARSRAGRQPSRELVTELHRQTGGNPLFIGEVVQLLASEGKLAATSDELSLRFAIPGALRDVITRRLGLLSERCRQVLSVASVLGPEVLLDVLRRLSETSADELLEVLDEAISAGLLVEMRGAPGRHRFSHGLIREVLYEEIKPARRIRLHLRVAEILEALRPSDAARHLGEIAHHYFEAAPAADPAKVRDYARRAADHAVRQLAYEEAVRLYRMGLQVMELDDSADDVARCELLLELGEAQMRAGETPRAKETFLGAAAIARRLDLPEYLARAALGYGGRFVWARAANDREVVPLLEDALKALGVRQTELRARVLARLAGALRDQPQPDARALLSLEAVELARRLGDPATLAYALDGRYSAIWAPDTLDERMAIAQEIIDIAEVTGEAERAFQGHHYRLSALLEQGDISGAKVELELNSRLAEALRQPAQRWYTRATTAILSLLEGRFADAERLTDEAFEEGRQAESMHAFGVVVLQRYALRREQGRVAEIEDVLRGTLEEYSFWPWMRCALVHLYTELDRMADARGLYENLAAQDFLDLPWDNDWLLGVSLLAEICVKLRDGRRAAILYEKVSPYWDRNGYGHPEFSMGSISRPLGLLATQLNRYEDAEQHFRRAVEMNRRMGAQPWLAHTQRDYAAMLLLRGGKGDDERARAELQAALSTAHALGMVALEQRIGELAPDLAVTASAPAVSGPSATPSASDRTSASSAVFRREGEYWTISYGNDSFRLRDAKGLRYLARLLSRPGQELLALELVQEGSSAAARGGHEPGLRAADPAGSEAQLDQAAKQAYRQRLHELQEELDEAESWNDPERAERARTEMEFIARELSRAVGLGGRDRPSGSASERARLSVTRAIRLAMGRIAEHSRALGDHLELTVHTGTYCAYRPDPRMASEWQL